MGSYAHLDLDYSRIDLDGYTHMWKKAGAEYLYLLLSVLPSLLPFGTLYTIALMICPVSNWHKTASTSLSIVISCLSIVLTSSTVIFARHPSNCISFCLLNSIMLMRYSLSSRTSLTIIHSACNRLWICIVVGLPFIGNHLLLTVVLSQVHS